MAIPLVDVVVGVYIGVIAGLFPGLVSFGLAYLFKYATDVSIPGFGVVVLAGALAGVSGGLMGVIDPALTGSWTGITAVIVILMISLWAHAQGDKLAAESPRRLTLQALRETRLSAELVDRVDGLGLVRVHPVGVVGDLEGYPPLPDNVRETIRADSWTFPTHLPVREIEDRLGDRLAAEHDLAEVTVSLDRRGRATIAAAPEAGGLSRRVPSGKRAVSVRTLLPTGLARGDQVTLHLPKTTVSGPVLSARTDGTEAQEPDDLTPPDPVDDEADDDEDPPPRPPRLAARGGEGRVTVALTADEAREVLHRTFAPMTVRPRGTPREYEAIGLLKAHGNRFRRVRVAETSPLAGETLAGARTRNRYGVAVLAVHRPDAPHVAPTGGERIHAGDELVVAGPPEKLRAFEEAAS